MARALPPRPRAASVPPPPDAIDAACRCASLGIDPDVGMSAALDATPDTVVILRPIFDDDDDGRLADVEVRYSNAAGRHRWYADAPLADVVGRRIFATLPDYSAALRGAYAQVAETGEPWHETRTLATPVGTRTLDITISSFGDGIVHIGRDVTEALEAAAAARESEERLQRIIDGVDAIIVAKASPEAPIVTSQQVVHILGYRPDELTTFQAWDVHVHPDDLEASERAWNDPSNAWDIEYRIRSAGGAWVWIADRGVRRLDPDGGLHAMFSTLVDVTARREAEALAARLMRLQRAAGDIDRVAARAADRGALFSEACRIAVTAGGLRLAWIGIVDDSLPGREVVVQASAGPGTAFLDDYHAVLDPTQPYSDRIASRAIREDRTIVIGIDEPMPEDVRAAARQFGFGTSVFVPLRRDGDPVGVFVVYREDAEAFDESELALLERIADDVSQRLVAFERAAAARLQAERDRLLVMEGMDGIVRMTVPEGRILDANPAVASMLGTTVDALVGTLATDRFVAGDPPGLQRLDRMAASETVPFERRLRTDDGSEITASGRARQLPDGTALVSLRDVTAERVLEAQLRQAQRLEAVGKLAGGIAHDFNNLLLAITGYAGLVRGSLDPAAPEQADLVEVEAAAARAASLTQQLLLFARHQRLEPAVFEAASVIEHLAPMLRRLLGEHIAIVLTSPPQPAYVRVDPGQFEQIVVNLAVNARDAMPTGGRLDIEVTVAEDITGAGLGIVRLVVRDTGTGMDQSTIDQAFTPFFTTKPVGQGTGLGLATVHGIVTASGGRISVASAKGRGTAFTIELPLVEAPEPRVISGGAAPSRDEGRSILLVEDDDSVRSVLSRLLARLGHAVIPTRSGTEALEQAAVREIDLLLTDVRMPGMQGPEVAQRVREVLPGLPVILMSGFDAESTPDLASLAPAVHLQKPFTPDAIAAAIGRLTGEAPQA